jgi:hypothetical protein
MATTEESLMHEIEWRVSEISIIKSLPYLHHITGAQKDVLVKHTIPVLYSLWEGYVQDCFEIYSREINAQGIPAEQICLSIVTHAVDMGLLLGNERVDFNKKIQFIGDIQSLLGKNINLPVQVPTESNVNFKVINRILFRFNLELLPEHPYKKLDTLTFFRNKLSHGEFSIVVSQDKINEMSLIVIESMHALAERIIDGCNKQTYLR